MTNDLTTSTEIAIGKGLLSKFKTTNFCIVGCGGVGSLFAEMLVGRSRYRGEKQPPP